MMSAQSFRLKKKVESLGGQHANDLCIWSTFEVLCLSPSSQEYLSYLQIEWLKRSRNCTLSPCSPLVSSFLYYIRFSVPVNCDVYAVTNMFPCKGSALYEAED